MHTGEKSVVQSLTQTGTIWPSSRGESSVKVSWFYDVDDEDMMEAGEDYSALVKIPFEMMKA